MSNSFYHWKITVLALSVLSLVSSACLPTLTPEPDPTPVIFQITITPALNSLRPLFKSCIEEQPGMNLIVSESPVPNLAQNGLAFSWGANNLSDHYAAILGEETLVFIVHPTNPLNDIPITNLQGIYQGTRSEWPHNEPAGEVQPWIYPSNADLQQIFTSIAGDSPFLANVASIAPDPAAMIEAVASNPTAVGFIPRRWLNGRVKELQIAGLEEDLLHRPILAISETEPKETQRSWLLCVQEKLAE